MPRTARIIIPNEPAVYHIMSRTALSGYPLEEIEKDFLLNLIKHLCSVYFIDLIGFCIMGNHFHLLTRFNPGDSFTDLEIMKRYGLCYGPDKILADGQIPFFRRKWSSISEFSKEIKQTFTRFYNKRHDRQGFFWGGRFKSVIVEKGETLINCLAYIDLNPVRAGIVERPEDYRWNSIGYHVQTLNRGAMLSLDFGLIEFGVKNSDERLAYYRKFLYETGAIDTGKGVLIKGDLLKEERQKGFELTRAERFKYRTRYFTDSCFIGSREFVQRNYQQFKDLFHTGKEKTPRRVKGLNGLYSLQRLTE